MSAERALAFRQRFLVDPRYWVRLLKFVVTSRTPRFETSDGRVVTLGEIVKTSVPFQPLMTVIILLRLPLFVARELVWKFARSKDCVGYGAGKGVGGLIYWFNLTRKSRRYGRFGLAHDSYWGMPLSVHSWPLAVAGLRALGYRAYVLVSALLLGGALALASGGRPWALAIIPLALCSTYFIYNLYAGTWETLSWGFAAMALVLSAKGQPILAGVCLAATQLTHPGASFLVVASLCANAIALRVPFVQVVIAGAVMAALVAWWIVPYFRARHKLGRGTIINEEWRPKKRWPVSDAYGAAVYAIFLLALVADRRPWLAIAGASLPLLVHAYNVRGGWVFSRYTTTNYKLVIAALATIAHPSPLVVAAFLLVVYTGQWFVTSTPTRFDWEFDLTPVRVDATQAKVRAAFAGATDGRVAFESSGFGGREAHATASLTYLLVDEPIDLFNASYVEIGDAAIYRAFCKQLNASASAEELEAACRGAGVRYLVAYSDEFRRTLTDRGYAQIAAVDAVNLSPVPLRPDTSFAVFELPWKVSIVEPEAPIAWQANEIRLQARAGVAYRLKLTTFPGWRAFQDGKPLPIVDGKPGMILSAPTDGEIVLRYRYRHYWQNSPRAA